MIYKQLNGPNCERLEFKAYIKLLPNCFSSQLREPIDKRSIGEHFVLPNFCKFSVSADVYTSAL